MTAAVVERWRRSVDGTSSSASGTTARVGARRCWPRSTGSAPDVVLDRGPAGGRRAGRAASPTTDMGPPVALLALRARRPAPRRLLAVRRVLPGVAGDALGGRRTASRSRFIDLPVGSGPRPPAGGAIETSPRSRTSRDADGRRRDRPSGPTRSPCWPRAAGYDDPERWWEDVVESRRDGARLRGGRRGDGRAARGAGPRQTHRDEHTRPARGVHAHSRCARRQGRARADRRGLRRLARAGAAPTRCPPAAADARAAARGCRRRKVGDDLGAVDALAAGLLRRATARGSTRPAGTTTCSPPPDHVVPRWLTKVAGRAARGGPAGLLRARHRGGPARRGAGARCAAGRWPGWPRSPRRPGRCCARATSCSSSCDPRRWWSASASARCPSDTPMVPLERDLRATAAAGCGSSRTPLETGARPRPAHAQRPAPAPGCCTGCACSASTGARRRGRPEPGTFREAGRWPGGPSSRRLVEASVWGTTVASPRRPRASVDRGRRRRDARWRR